MMGSGAVKMQKAFSEGTQRLTNGGSGTGKVTDDMDSMDSNVRVKVEAGDLGSNGRVADEKRLSGQGRGRDVALERSQKRNPYFGVPLDTLLAREGTKVPRLVVEICDYLYTNGLHHEGLFRLSGSAKAMEMLRQAYNSKGTANFEDIVDVVSTACLLKQFLRELPQGLIDDATTELMVNEFDSNGSHWTVDDPYMVDDMRQLLKGISRSSFATLKYVISFLAVLVQHAADNKMNSSALGTVFGPNIFRCAEGVQGLQQQVLANGLTAKLIELYNVFFLEDDEVSPYSVTYRFPKDVFKRVAPPRPPPPVVEATWGDSSPRPQPSPRKGKAGKRRAPGPPVDDTADSSRLDSSTRTSDDEFINDFLRSASPSLLDSDKSDIFPMSPRVTPSTNPLVTSVISSVVHDRLFGESSTDDDRPQVAPKPVVLRKAPVLDRQIQQSDSSISQTEADSSEMSLKDKLKFFESAEKSRPADVNDGYRPVAKQRHSMPPSTSASATSQHNGTQGLVTSVSLVEAVEREVKVDHFSLLTDTQPAPAPRKPRKSTPAAPSNGNNRHSDGDKVTDPFDSISMHAASALTSAKRVTGPGNRRVPSRNTRHQSIDNDADDVHPQPLNGHRGDTDARSRSQRPTPPVESKTIVPPLDFGEPDEPRQTNSLKRNMKKSLSTDTDNTRSHTLPHNSRPKTVDLTPDPDLHEDVKKPGHKSAVMQQRSGRVKDEEEEPFPAVTMKRTTAVISDQTAQMKALTKKIQAMKQVIREFEDKFEEENLYKPSQAEKAAVREIKVAMIELAQARKDLRSLRDAEGGSPSQDRSPSPPRTLAWSEGTMALKDSQLTNAPVRPVSGDKVQSSSRKLDVVSDAEAEMERRLEQWRQAAGRPFNLALMTPDEMLEEKVCIQKVLLEFESVHGRPTAKSVKEIMRPIYDRYRNVKKFLSNPPPVAIRIPTMQQQDEEEDEDGEGHSDRWSSHGAPTPLDTAFHRQTGSPASDNMRSLSAKQLEAELKRLSSEKKKLGAVLNSFEREFQRKNGRKIEKDDRQPMAREYQQYKKLKAEIKLVEGLLAEYDNHGNHGPVGTAV